ncbi:hypothetical protein ACFWM0_17125 [Streptomyces sp. NPDC058405]|uniref:hypothetical protein n=1 Tax=Streptomyces sp. NPDC058405 TaxID=3346482 RepID=UPI0036516136
MVAALDGDLPSAEVIGKWAVFHLSAGHGQALTTYFSASGNLACVAIEARQGPQVTLSALRLVGCPLEAG